MSNVDKVKVHGQYYYILSPSIVGDYVETIGEGCKNPNGYAQGKVFLGVNNGVEYLYKASQAISYQETITENYNCGRRTLDDIGGNASTPDISMTASVDGTIGTPGVVVTESGSVEFPNFDLAFTGLKGETGTSAYESAVAGGYSRTEAKFYEDLGNFADYANTAETSATNAAQSESNASAGATIAMSMARTASTSAYNAADSEAAALLSEQNAAASEAILNYYVNYVIPRFTIANNRLYLKDTATQSFIVANNRLYIQNPS